jgi:methyl-accepting chemotaxis protein
MTRAEASHSVTAAGLSSIARTADLVMFVTAVASAIAAVAIGSHFGTLATALPACGVLLALAAAGFFGWRGSPLSCGLLTFCNVALVALHIQLGRGTIEFHFGVFVLLGLLLAYRDWRPLVFAAGLFALHHVVFDRLQAAGAGLYCTPQADFWKTMMHAVYVVVQTGIEISLAMSLRNAALEGAELAAIVRSVDRGGELCLDVGPLAVRTPIAGMLKAAVLKMDSAMRDVHAAAGSIEVAASEIAIGNHDLSQRTEAQASNLQRTAASMEQLTGTVSSTADAANQAKDVAGAASAAAREGGAAVGRIIETMSGISESSRQIADIIGVIDGIAFQTNILALNAAVEAARAGEQGRGFAVVASEVRSLAQRSAQAAREIKQLIGASSERVDAGAHLVKAAGGTIVEVVDQAQRVSELIAEISQAASEQTAGIGQIGLAVTQLDAVTQQNSALVEEGAAATDCLRQQAVQLNAVVRRFQLSQA